MTQTPTSLVRDVMTNASPANKARDPIDHNGH